MSEVGRTVAVMAHDLAYLRQSSCAYGRNYLAMQTLINAGEMLTDGVGLRAYCLVRGDVVRCIRKRMFYPISRLIGRVKDEGVRS